MRRFRAPDRNQLMLLPPCLDDLLRPDHPARFVVKFVDSCNLSAFYAEYDGNGSGAPPYDPAMMVALLLYGYVIGICSSRKLEREVDENLGFRYIVAELRPDHDTIADFRKRHAEHLKGLFKQAVEVAMKQAAVGLNLVAIDGTKMRADTSKKNLRTKEQLELEQHAIKQQIDHYFQKCESEDQLEDASFGKGRNPNFLPPELANEEALEQFIKDAMRKPPEQIEKDENDNDDDDPPKPRPTTKYEAKLLRRLEKLKAAQAALEEKERKRKEGDPTGKRQRDIERQRGKAYVEQINVVDPESRLMLFNEGGYRDGYNGQIAVDADNGIIVAASLTQDANDILQLSPVTKQIKENTGCYPAHAVADTGYCNFEHIASFPRVDFYVRPKKRTANESPDTKAESMRAKLDTELGKALYAKRQAVVEPVFGTLKFARKFGRFLCRGLEMAATEWMMMCTAHNLLKLMRLNIVPS